MHAFSSFLQSTSIQKCLPESGFESSFMLHTVLTEGVEEPGIVLHGCNPITGKVERQEDQGSQTKLRHVASLRIA